MGRFILLTFGFLGWAFYEMSGGAEFEPASDRVARATPAPETTETRAPQVADADAPVVDAAASTEQEVTRVALNLTSVQETAPEAEVGTTEPANIDPVTRVAFNSDTTESGDTPAIIPSLIVPGDTGSASGTVPDTRIVTGSRVNVRGGPGTDFGVVGKLVEGDAVEVIEEDGNGWVRMRAISTGEEGWMADFLLTTG